MVRTIIRINVNEEGTIFFSEYSDCYAIRISRCIESKQLDDIWKKFIEFVKNSGGLKNETNKKNI